jgi:hypothetical protein
MARSGFDSLGERTSSNTSAAVVSNADGIEGVASACRKGDANQRDTLECHWRDADCHRSRVVKLL